MATIKKEKILVQRADRLGDTIFSLPVIETLNKKYPQHDIHVLTSPIGEKIFRIHPLVKKVLVINTNSDHKFKEVADTVKRIKKEKYAVYISLWNHPLMAFLGWLSRIPVRIGDATNPSLKWLYTTTCKQSWHNYCRHQIEFNLELLKPLGIKNQDVVTKLYTHQHTDEKVSKVLRKYLSPEKEMVLLFCGTGGTNLSIPDVVLEELVVLIEKTEKYTVIVCGQVPKTSPLLSITLKNGLNLLNKTNILELISLIKLSDYVIGSDTGPIHIAGFLKKPLVFFSPIKPNPPTRWGPQTDYIRIIRKEYTCGHTGNERCDPSCFSYLDAQYLYNTFCELVAGKHLNQQLSVRQRTRYFLLNSIRVLQVAKNESQLSILEKSVKKYRKKGLVVDLTLLDPYSIKSIFNLLSIIKVKNINVIQGPIPKWLVKFIRFYMGTVMQYIVPIHVHQSLNTYVGLKGYLKMYTKKWDS